MNSSVLRSPLRRLVCAVLALAASGALHAARAADAVAAPPAAPLILVSIDGFRPDYLQRGVTPNLTELAAKGVRAEAMRPSFPSLTFPNHYTLVTGMRPDRNGIVGNTMDDSSIPGVRFTLSNRDATGDRRWWDQAEPVWVTAENNGLRSATMFWPGSEAAIHGVRPSLWSAFDGKVPPDARVDTVLGWLDQPARPAFLTLYFDDVDHAGHASGPDAEATTQSAALVDAAIGRLRAGLKARNIDANLIIVSDHGMSATSNQRVVRLDQIAASDSYSLVTAGAYAALEAKPGQETVLAAALLKPHEHMQCWRKEDIPARLHYGRNPRVPGFICLAETGWQIVADERAAKRPSGGAHGYDNMAPEMQALFIASGPSFKPGTVVAPFDNVDVYPLMMKLLGLTPLPTDGGPALLPALKDISGQ